MFSNFSSYQDDDDTDGQLVMDMMFNQIFRTIDSDIEKLSKPDYANFNEIREYLMFSICFFFPINFTFREKFPDVRADFIKVIISQFDGNIFATSFACFLSQNGFSHLLRNGLKVSIYKDSFNDISAL